MKRILVPCDFSAEAMNAFHSAISLANMEDSELHLLHVVELPVMHDALLMPAFNYEESLIHALKERAEKGFQKMINDQGKISTTIHPHIQFGPTLTMILNFITENTMDLVIMGTKGATGLKEVFIGSHAEKIVRSSTVPVLVVRKKLVGESTSRIVFPAPVNFHEENELTRRVKQLQNFFQASLHLVWVNTPANFTPDRETKNRLKDFADKHMLANYTINIVNDIYEEAGIVQFAHEINADMIAMGTHGRKGLAHLFSGSLTEDLVNHIDLPVWTYSEHKVLEHHTNPV